MFFLTNIISLFHVIVFYCQCCGFAQRTIVYVRTNMELKIKNILHLYVITAKTLVDMTQK